MGRTQARERRSACCRPLLTQWKRPTRACCLRKRRITSRLRSSSEPSKRKNTNHPRRNQTRNKRCCGNGFKKWLKTVECGRYVGSSCPGAQKWPGEAKVSTENEEVFHLYPSPQTDTSRTFYIYRERRDVNRKKCCSVEGSKQLMFSRINTQIRK